MMMTEWFWIMLLLVFFIVPIGYAWRSRGWGPPYPRYVQRKRSERFGGSARFNHEAWGWAGDLVWLLAAGVLLWAVFEKWWIA